MPPRHIAFGSAAVFACIVLNSVFFINYVEEIWESRLSYLKSAKRVELIRPRVCILVTGSNSTAVVSSLAATIKRDHSFAYGLFVSDGSASPNMFPDQFPVSAVLHSVRTVQNASVIKTLLFAAGIKACAFYLIVHDGVKFYSPGWAAILVSALYRLDPSYLGAVSPAGCRDCIFVHNTHRRIFQGQQYPADECWAEWVRSVYGPCRLGTAVFSEINGGAQPACSLHSTALESSGRLRLAKFTGSRSGCNSRRVNATW
jgi:hypothetical protein